MTKPEDKLEALANKYKSVWKVEDDATIPNILPSPYPDMPPFEVTKEGVLKQLTNLNVHKSTGPDGPEPYLLKVLAPIIAPMLMNIFRQSINVNKIPRDWKIQGKIKRNRSHLRV